MYSSDLIYFGFVIIIIERIAIVDMFAGREKKNWSKHWKKGIFMCSRR